MTDSPYEAQGGNGRRPPVAPEAIKIKAPWPQRFVERILAATGVVALAEELSIVNLRGAIETWVGMYTDFVDRLWSFLLGWIDFWNIRIDQGEAYLLTVVLILAVPIARAEAKFERAKLDEGLVSHLLLQAFVCAVFVIPSALLLLVIPSPISLRVVGVLLGAAFLVMFFVLEADGANAGSKAARDELWSTLVIVALILIINTGLSA